MQILRSDIKPFAAEQPPQSRVKIPRRMVSSAGETGNEKPPRAMDRLFFSRSLRKNQPVENGRFGAWAGILTQAGDR